MISYFASFQDTWENLTRKYIFNPLGMSSTDFTHEADMTKDNIAIPYLIDFEDDEWRSTSFELHA